MLKILPVPFFNSDLKDMQDALALWFSQGDNFSPGFFEKWYNKYGVSDIVALEKAEALLDAHRAWAEKCNI